MFYFDELNGCKILRSDFIDKKKYEGIDIFFTTRGDKTPVSEIAVSRVLTPEQTHSSNIADVDEREEYPETDGLILSQPDTAIYLRFADCTPLVFYDPLHNVAAISHAGWRGTAARIGVKTVAKMVLNHSSKPEDIIVLIGPAISQCCYEVSEEVKNTLLNTVKDTKDLFKDRNVDLKKINARQLEEIGVKKIDICPYCTSCNNDLFYSYRKENETKERHFAVAILEKPKEDKKN